MMRIRIVVACILAPLLTQCYLTGTWNSENINTDLKEDMRIRARDIISSVAVGDSAKFLGMSNRKSITGEEVIQLIQITSPIFQSGQFQVLNEFHHKISSPGSATSVRTGFTGDRDYQISFIPLARENYVVVASWTYGIRDYCITLLFGKHGTAWLLDMIQVGMIKALNKDAWDWYLSAHEQYAQGFLVNANNHLALATSLLKPANQNWQYMQEEVVISFNEQVRHELEKTYQLPMALDDVSGQPELMTVSAILSDGEFATLVEYTTKSNFTDTLALRIECEYVHEALPSLFKGFDQDVKTIVYRAYEQAPRGNQRMPYYAIMMHYE